MLLWILSDLHVESTRGWDLPGPAERPHFDVLVVAGDLIPRMERGVRWLLERVPDKPCVYVGGNHESYGTDIDRGFEKAKQAAQGSNVYVLHNEKILVGDVTFAGATCWTDFALFGDVHRAMTVAADNMNDFRKIRTNRYLERFRPPHALARHRETRAFLESEMRKSRPGPLVVVTPHAPHPGRLRLSDPPTSNEILTAAYRSDLTALMSPAPDDGHGALQPADVWIYGHTHESFDARIGSTRVVSNAKGYGPWFPRHRSWDNRHFNPNFIIEI